MKHAYKAVARWLTVVAEAMTLRGVKRNVEVTRPVIQGLTGLVKKKKINFEMNSDTEFIHMQK